jgi:hypothetical protein
MSRTETIVGVTALADNFISVITNSEKFISSEIVVSDILLPFSNTLIEVRKFNLKPSSFPDINECEYFIESLQHNPWASGPLYFFNIKHFLVKKCGQTLFLGDCYSWIKDPLLQHAYDKSSGSLNI